MDVEQIASQIEQQVERLISAGRERQHESSRTTSAEAGWSLSEVLAHVAEFIPYWTDQAVSVARRDGDGEPFGRTHGDPAREAAVRDHARDPLDLADTRVRRAAETGIAALKRIPAEGWTRTARHARRGEMDVAQIVQQFLLDHLDEHVAQAEAAARAR